MNVSAYYFYYFFNLWYQPLNINLVWYMVRGSSRKKTPLPYILAIDRLTYSTTKDANDLIDCGQNIVFDSQ